MHAQDSQAREALRMTGYTAQVMSLLGKVNEEPVRRIDAMIPGYSEPDDFFHSPNLAEQRGKEMDQYDVRPELPFDDPMRYGQRPKTDSGKDTSPI